MADEPIKPSTFTSASAAQAAPFMHDTRDINVQLLREVQRLEQLTTQRMDGIEKAVTVAHEDLVRMPTAVQQAVGALKELVDTKFATHIEKFVGIARQFEQLDKQLDKSAEDSKLALANALQAAKELVSVQNENSKESIAKSDNGTDRKLEAQGTLINTMRDNFITSINEVKARQDRMESQAAGRAEQKTEARNDTSLWVAIGSLAVGAVLGALGFVIAK